MGCIEMWKGEVLVTDVGASFPTFFPYNAMYEYKKSFSAFSLIE